MAARIDLQARTFAELRFYEELNDFLAPERRCRVPEEVWETQEAFTECAFSGEARTTSS